MKNGALFTSKSNEWATPKSLYKDLDNEFNFTLDPCSTHDNAKCEKHYTLSEDGLNRSWDGEVVFMNPPYGRQIGKWIEKAYKESLKGSTVVCLIPARTDTIAWHNYIFGKAKDIRFIKGRLKFGDSTGSAPFPSAVIVFSQ